MGFKKVFKKLTCRPVKQEQSDVERGTRKTDSLIPSHDDNDHSILGPIRRAQTSSRGASARRARNTREEGCSRYMLELQDRDLFTIRDRNGKYLDIPRSLAPEPKIWMMLFKLVILAWVAYLFSEEWSTTHPTRFFFATFDHWALTCTLLYLWCSFCCNAFSRFHKHAPADNDTATTTPTTTSINPRRHLPTKLHKITWFLFDVAAPSQILASLGFWLFQFEHGKNLEDDLVVHGTVLLLVLVEGLVINRVPVRVNHQWFFFGLVYTFLLWSLIHSYTSMGNPMAKYGTDDLYPFLRWLRHPFWTTLWVLIIFFIITPLVYLFVWALSLFDFLFCFEGNNRRYLSRDESKPLEAYVESQA